MRVTAAKLGGALFVLSTIVAPFKPAMSQGQDPASAYNNSVFCSSYFYIAYDDAKFNKAQKDAIDELGGYYATKAETDGSKLKKSKFDVSADMERARMALSSNIGKMRDWEQRCLVAAKLDAPGPYAKAYGK